MKTKILLAVCVMALALISCKKEPIKGDKGDKGDNGNANVTSIILNVSNWTWNSSDKWSYATWNNIPELNYNVINSGAVILYEGSVGDWLSMPYTVGGGLSSNKTLSTVFEYQLNTISVFKIVSDGSNISPSATQYRLVCIPSAIIKKNPNVNWKNYSEVKQALRLKD